jgi:hypothetical protein
VRLERSNPRGAAGILAAANFPTICGHGIWHFGCTYNPQPVAAVIGLATGAVLAIVMSHLTPHSSRFAVINKDDVYSK